MVQSSTHCTKRRNPLVAKALGATLVIVASACQRERARVDTASGALDTAAATVTRAINPNATRWTSPAILAYAEAANRSEMDLGTLGARKAISADVRAFAHRIVADHTKMLADVQALATRANVVVDTTTNDVRDVLAHERDEMTDLAARTAGPAWDREFIDRMIANHKNTLARLQDAARNTTDPALTKALTQATGVVQEHLTAAEVLKSKLR